MHSHSASERSVGYLFLMRARVANHYPTHPFRTVSEEEFSETRMRRTEYLWSNTGETGSRNIHSRRMFPQNVGILNEYAAREPRVGAISSQRSRSTRTNTSP